MGNGENAKCPYCGSVVSLHDDGCLKCGANDIELHVAWNLRDEDELDEAVKKIDDDDVGIDDWL